MSPTSHPPRGRNFRADEIRSTAPQYLSSRNFVTVDWGAISRTYDSNVTSRFGPPAAKGGNRLRGLGAWFLDFVGANIQSRATFVLGVMLGLRLG